MLHLTKKIKRREKYKYLNINIEEKYFSDLNLEEIKREIKESNCKYICFFEENYPKELLELEDFPIVIFVKGNISALARYKIGVIGSRENTEYGKRVTKNIVEVIDDEVAFVSGMAKGIDTIALEGSFENKGLPIGVLAYGFNYCYPKKNKMLMHNIEEKGILVTEYMPTSPPEKWKFVARNRIIAALSKILIVVEAKERSGTLITVANALEIGREIMVVPGEMDSINHKGTNFLINDGATMITSYKDVLDMYKCTKN
jgi:DNA processing protein